jgi:hypothetical protein
MKHRRKETSVKKKMGIALFSMLAIWGWQAHAVVIVTDMSIVDTIPGLAGSTTFGDDMDDMTVQANFADGTNEILSWADTGPGSGGVTGTNWSLTQSGNTFTSLSWTFTNSTGSAVLDLELNGAPGFTIFDTFFGGIGTPGSGGGKDFDTNLLDDSFVTATYSRAVAIGAAPAVGDIFHLLSVDFGSTGVSDSSFNITQDTDTGLVPIPPALYLFGTGLLGLIGIARRKKAA